MTEHGKGGSRADQGYAQAIADQVSRDSLASGETNDSYRDRLIAVVEALLERLDAAKEAVG